jgi:hypothetical protein
MAEITGINYQVLCDKKLGIVSFDDLNINRTNSCFLLSYKQSNYGISKWVSPKRTRSYPFERVYNTYCTAKKITIIPIIKDEGLNGDRDFIQWDTVSLMSLLDVYVIFAYYNSASIHKSRTNKVSKQKFDNDYIKSKIEEIYNYKSSALHWNLKEINCTLPLLIYKVKDLYQQLSEELKVKFHDTSGIEKFKVQFEKGVDEFMITSRNKAFNARNREVLVKQPKEYLTTACKASITIRNYLGGLYYFTTDEVLIDSNKVYLIESKHTITSKLPGVPDVKDGLLKMVLYSNLVNVKVGDQLLEPKPVLKLTSTHIKGTISSKSESNFIDSFKSDNLLNKKKCEFLDTLFLEANKNNFQIIISGVE